MSMTLLEKLDPCLDWVPDDERAARLDEAVERLCAGEAIAGNAEPATLTASQRRFSAARIAAGGATAGALAVVAGFGLPGGGNRLRPGDARAAIVSAAEHTAAFTSGRVTWIESV